MIDRLTDRELEVFDLLGTGTHRTRNCRAHEAQHQDRRNPPRQDQDEAQDSVHGHPHAPCGAMGARTRLSHATRAAQTHAYCGARSRASGMHPTVYAASSSDSSIAGPGSRRRRPTSRRRLRARFSRDWAVRSALVTAAKSLAADSSMYNVPRDSVFRLQSTMRNPRARLAPGNGDALFHRPRHGKPNERKMASRFGFYKRQDPCIVPLFCQPNCPLHRLTLLPIEIAKPRQSTLSPPRQCHRITLHRSIRVHDGHVLLIILRM